MDWSETSAIKYRPASEFLPTPPGAGPPWLNWAFSGGRRAAAAVCGSYRQMILSLLFIALSVVTRPTFVLLSNGRIPASASSPSLPPAP